MNDREIVVRTVCFVYNIVKGVARVDHSNEPRSRRRVKVKGDVPFYQDRSGFREEGEKKRRWWIPLVFLLIIGAAAGTLWFFDNRSESGLFHELIETLIAGEEEIQITIPAALFTGEDLDEIFAAAIEEHGVDEIVPVEDDKLVYKMSPEAKASLLKEAQDQLEKKLTALKDERQYDYLVEISYASSFDDFFLSTNLDQPDKALPVASELYMAAVYYQYLYDAEELVKEVVIVIESKETGEQERLAYPGDLNRAVSIMERPEVADEEPLTPGAGDKVVVDTGPDNLNLRDGPEITYLIIDVLSSGTELEVIDEEGEWLNVITPDEQEGWVHGDYVIITDVEE